MYGASETKPPRGGFRSWANERHSAFHLHCGLYSAVAVFSFLEAGPLQQLLLRCRIRIAGACTCTPRSTGKTQNGLWDVGLRGELGELAVKSGRRTAEPPAWYMVERWEKADL
jgi:hypothetical protein